ncbi:MAG: YcbK family protein [Desulfatitalea sp.]|nr:YcbK family protein [Desulfatitalea sp.]
MSPGFRSAWTLLLLLALCAGMSTQAAAEPPISRFNYNGDGRLHLINAKSGAVFNGVYRGADGAFDPAARHAIQRVFDAPPDEPLAGISLRLIAFLDYLETQLNPGARIEIASGWRSPTYNTQLRNTGRLAASASLHQYGMAADIQIAGVDSRRVWHFVRDLGFGGAGFYQGRLVHVDVGPARFWDQTTSGVGTDISTENKLIGLVTDYDRYRPGDPVVLRFIRMTRFPVAVASMWSLEQVPADDGALETVAPFKPHFTIAADDPCPSFPDIGAMMNITGVLPDDLAPGRYGIRAHFCEKGAEAMPDTVVTPLFEVLERRAPTDF